jgi:mRNA interferase MazF
VARRVARGEVWLYRFAHPDKRRPVVILGRTDALAAMNTALVAPVTSTIRDVPSQVPLGVDDGMKRPCAVSLDHVQTVRQSDLQRYVTTLRPEVMTAVCRALGVAAGCS